ncbi:MAG: porin family protein [Bacteroidota bacterium]|nr:porin family protein [Bacteroidota bacterium]
MKKILLLSLFALLFSLNVNSQIYIGPKAGLSFSNLTGNLGYYLANTDQPFIENGYNGFSLGLDFQYVLNESSSLVTDILYTNKGGLFETPDPTKRILEYQLNYIEIPILYKYDFDLDYLIVYTNIGPYLSFLAGGTGKRYGASWDTRTNDIKKFFDESDKQPYSNIDVGLCLGAGASYEIGPGNAFAEMRYNIGLIDVAKDSEDSFYKNIGKNRVFNIFLGYRFYLDVAKD